MPARPSSLAIRSLAASSPCTLSLHSTRPCIPLLHGPTSTSQGLNSSSTTIWRPFHTSRTLLEAEKSHYDVLGVPPTATKADLKKRFYTLSKETHPDMQPDDPNAASRFSQVSEAYATLINEERRKIYDRDVMPRFDRAAARAANRPRGGTYAGSRPATGLSKRRGTFRGPPPSFYAQGGRDGPQVDSAAYARREQEMYDRAQAGQFDPSQYSQPGQWDPSFNPEPVYKTQTMEDQRRSSRRQADEQMARAIMEESGNFWGRFIVVSGIVAFGVGVGTMVNRMSESPKGGLIRADGTRRPGYTTNR